MENERSTITQQQSQSTNFSSGKRKEVDQVDNASKRIRQSVVVQGLLGDLLNLAGQKSKLFANKSNGSLTLTKQICAAVKKKIDSFLASKPCQTFTGADVDNVILELWSKLDLSPKHHDIIQTISSQTEDKIHLAAIQVLEALIVMQEAIDREETEKDPQNTNQTQKEEPLSAEEKDLVDRMFCVLTFALAELISRCNPLPATTTALSHLRFGPADQTSSWVTKTFCVTLWTILRAHGWTVWIPAFELPLSNCIQSNESPSDVLAHIPMPADSQDSLMFEPKDTTTSGLVLKSMQTLSCLLAMVPSHRLPKEVVSGPLKSFLLEVCRNDKLPSMRVVKGINMVAHLVPLLFAPVFCDKLHVSLQRLHSLKQQSKETCRLALFVVDTFACLASHEMFDCHKIFSPFLEAALAMECAVRDHSMQDKYSLVPLLVHLLSEHPKRATEVLLRQRRFVSVQVQKQCNNLVQELIAECRVEVTNVVIGHLPSFRFDFAIAVDTMKLWRDMSDVEVCVCDEELESVKLEAVFAVHGIIVVSKSTFFKNVLMSGFRISVSGSGKRTVTISGQPVWAIHTVLKWMYSSCVVQITANQTQSTSINKNNVCDYVMIPNGASTNISLPIEDALAVYRAADYLGVDELCGLLGAEFCRSAITLATVSDLTFVAVELTSLGVRFGPRLLRRCHQYTLQHPHEMVGSLALLAGLLCVEHNANRMSSFSQDMGVLEEQATRPVFDEDQLISIAEEVGFLCNPDLQNQPIQQPPTQKIDALTQSATTTQASLC
eukprot:c12120_g1_i1.p1 GENE.c12120_g1_i1~~c12120_g1_i1.p1  ORF type:complete len:776 (+),score=183.26 c12120_g1_i1:44-2371(+)